MLFNNKEMSVNAEPAPRFATDTTMRTSLDLASKLEASRRASSARHDTTTSSTLEGASSISAGAASYTPPKDLARRRTPCAQSSPFSTSTRNKSWM